VLPGGGRMLTFSDVTDLVRLAKQYERLAITDGLTGLFNRRHFLARGEAEWQRFARYQRPLTLLMLDIDHFKSINDRFGHDAGDRAIVQVADACNDDRRGIDIVARLGGDEFVLLLPETDVEQAAVVAERLRARIAASALLVDGGADVPLTVSIGLAAATSSMSGVPQSRRRRACDGARRLRHRGGMRRTGLCILSTQPKEQLMSDRLQGPGAGILMAAMAMAVVAVTAGVAAARDACRTNYYRCAMNNGGRLDPANPGCCWNPIAGKGNINLQVCPVISTSAI
jgi:diguanylate cyclase (GGDEF)-like protein